MEDHGQIITHFEMLFGQDIDHEVIKIVLQACEWNSDEAHEKLTAMSDSSQLVLPNSDERSPPLSTNGPVDSHNIATDSDDNTTIDSYNQSFAHVLSLKVNSDVKAQNLVPVTSLNKNRDFFDSYEVEKVKKLLKEKKVLIIMRGLPGSGKSTLAHFLCQNTGITGIILSTDDYFLDNSKNYNFIPAQLPQAHQWNEERAKLCIQRGFSTIFIDNTNLQLWEFVPYIRLGRANNYEIVLLEPQTPWRYQCRELAKKCVHNITEKKITDMKLRFDKNVCIDKVLCQLKVTKGSDANMALALPKEFVDVTKNNIDCHLDFINKCTNVLVPPENDQTLNIDEINFSSEINCPSENKNSEYKLSDSMATIENLKIDSHVPLAGDLDQSWSKVNEEYTGSTETEENKGSTETEENQGSTETEENKGSTETEENKGSTETEENKGSTENEENEGSNENLEWGALSSSNVNGAISWDLSQSQNIKEVNGLDPKPARNIKKNIPTRINDFKESDHDSIIWNTVDSPQNSWDCEKEVATSSPITPLHSGAVPKITQNSSVPEIDSENIEQQINQSCKSMVDCSTQFCTFDYFLVNSDSKFIEGNPSSFVPSLPKEVKFNEPLTKTKLFLHKSSMTDDFVAPTLESNYALNILTSLFPRIPIIELKDVLKHCKFNINWATEILLEDGYEIADSFTKLDPVITNQVEEDTIPVERKIIQPMSNENEVKDALSETNRSEEVSDEDKLKLLQIKNEIESSFQISQTVDDKILRLTQKDHCDLNIYKIKKKKYNVDNASNVNDKFLLGKDDENFGYMHMELSPSFASQLLKTFGPIGSSYQISDFTKEELSINLSLELSYQIFQCWVETLNHIDNKILVPNILKEDEELARKLQEEENAKAVVSNEVEDPPTSMQEIIDLEKALQLSNIQCNRKVEEKMSSILSLKKLQEEFSHVDPSAIESLYYYQGNKYETTKSLLTYRYGSVKSTPKVVLAPGTVIEKNSKFSKYDGSNEASDWEDFTIIVDDPQNYRDEAEIHFLERKKALEKVKEASRNGMSAVASYYAQIASEHLTKSKEANERAAKKIVDAFNANKAPNTLDLHLLHVAEALKETQRFLAGKKRVLQQNNLPELEVTIITGKGVHSIGKEPRLKPAIGYFLKCEGYVVKEYAGMFKVKLQNGS